MPDNENGKSMTSIQQKMSSVVVFETIGHEVFLECLLSRILLQNWGENQLKSLILSDSADLQLGEPHISVLDQILSYLYKTQLSKLSLPALFSSIFILIALNYLSPNSYFGPSYSRQ